MELHSNLGPKILDKCGSDVMYNEKRTNLLYKGFKWEKSFIIVEALEAITLFNFPDSVSIVSSKMSGIQVRTDVHRYQHTYIHKYIHTYIHIYIHTYIHTFIHAYMQTSY